MASLSTLYEKSDRLPKLNYTNWYYWDKLLCSKLRACKLYKYVDGTYTGIAAPVAEDDNPPAQGEQQEGPQAPKPQDPPKEDPDKKKELEDEQAEHSAVMNYIMGAVSPELFTMICDFDTAKEQYQHLRSVAKPSGKTQLNTLLKEYRNFRIDSTMSVDDVASRLSTIQHQIAELDPSRKIPEEEKISFFLDLFDGLDPRYESVVFHLERADKLSWGDAIAQLKARQDKIRGDAATDAIALYTAGSRDRKGKGSVGNPGL